jgi:hypothetical protein
MARLRFVSSCAFVPTALWLVTALSACGDAADDGTTAASASDGTAGDSAATTTPDTSTTTAGMTTSASTTASGTSTTGPGTDTDVEPEVAWPTLDCDPLVPAYCAFPFPSNVFTAADATTPTGRRLALAQATMPGTRGGNRGLPDAVNTRDGFGPNASLMAHLPGATATGLPSPITIERSLAADSPTVILDADTGERIAHFAEVDVNARADDERTFYLRPVVNFREGHRYIVAIRDVRDAQGALVPASPAFAALRDGTASDEPSVDARRGLYADIFARLATAGVERADVQLAWDFTVGSVEDLTGEMITMRDLALAAVGEDGPPYVIDSVAMDVSEDVAIQVRGRVTVPLFLDIPGPGGVLSRDPSGAPVQNGTAEYPFIVIVPYSALDTPAPIVNYGHGLFGSFLEPTDSSFGRFANDQNIIYVSMDWIGMASADVLPIAGIVDSGNLEEFATVPDRLRQSMVNFMVSHRMARGAMVDDPALQGPNGPVIDPTEGYFFGGSQGGIFGATFMAVTTDVERGVLAVPGQPYNLLLERSVNFDMFNAIIEGAYPSAFDKAMVLSIAQLLWDRVEPAGYSHHIRDNLLPGTPAHEVLLLVSIGDHQVSTLGAHIMARAIGARNLRPTNRAPFGIEEVDGPATGSGMIEFDFGLPAEPLENVPMSEGQDPHGRLREIDAAFRTSAQFFRTGELVNLCDGACDPN